MGQRNVCDAGGDAGGSFPETRAGAGRSGDDGGRTDADRSGDESGGGRGRANAGRSGGDVFRIEVGGGAGVGDRVEVRGGVGVGSWTRLKLLRQPRSFETRLGASEDSDEIWVCMLTHETIGWRGRKRRKLRGMKSSDHKGGGVDRPGGSGFNGPQ